MSETLASHNADIRENPNGEDDNPRGRVFGHDRQCEGEDPGQGGHPAGSAAPDLRRKAAGGRAHPCRLQHPEGVHPPPRPPPPRRRQEAQEEDLHQAQEDQAQAQEGQARPPPVLQGRRLRQAPEAPQGVPQCRMWRRDLHGQPLRPPLLWQVRIDLCLPEI